MANVCKKRTRPPGGVDDGAEIVKTKKVKFALPDETCSNASKSSKSHPSIPIDGRNLLHALLFPLDRDTFLAQYWTKQAYHVLVDAPDRVHDLLNGPFPFHLKTLLQQTASDKIHVWMRASSSSSSSSSKSAELLSFSVDEADSAMSCYRCGGNLYFRASQQLTDMFIPSLMTDLGVGIGTFYAEQSLRGEIEVFASHKQHVTEWHTDFQHNFTIQLYGRKRWYLLPIEEDTNSFFNVYRGTTPHYGNRSESDMESKECQIKLHTAECASFDYERWRQFEVEQRFRDKIKVIELTPGSVLYFPSGQWHKVETVSEESLSINLSIVPMTYSQLLGNAINHFMSVQPQFRTPILYNDMAHTNTVLKTLCHDLQQFVSTMSAHPSCVVPHSFSNHSLTANNTVCIEMVDFDDADDEEDEEDDDVADQHTAKPPVITQDTKFVINPLAIVIPSEAVYGVKNEIQTSESQLQSNFATLTDLDECGDDDDDDDDDETHEGNGPHPDDEDGEPHEEKDSAVLKEYILHVNFGGAENFSSISRVILQCKKEETIAIINWICDKRKQLPKEKAIKFECSNVKCFIAKPNKLSISDKELHHVLRVLTFFGFIIVCD